MSGVLVRKEKNGVSFYNQYSSTIIFFYNLSTPNLDHLLTGQPALFMWYGNNVFTGVTSEDWNIVNSTW